MVSGKTETERKYEAPPENQQLPSLAALPHVTAESEPEQETLDAQYYDTSDLRLIRSGVTLRRRQGGHDAGWHLKLPAGPDARRELHWPLGEPGGGVPDEAARLVRAYSRGEPLVPVAHIRTSRQRRTLRGADGPLAEVVLDDVAAEALGVSAAVSRWQEAEVELADGNRQLLDDAEELLRRAGFRPAPHAAKLERALQARLPAAAGRELSRWSAAGEVIAAYLRGQTAKMLSQDPLIRLDTPDSVHQMRVTCRRVRAALQSFGTVIPAARTRQLRNELRWLGQVLGGARDTEVLAERIGDETRQLPPELLLGPVQARVRAHFGPLRADARRAVLEALDSDRYLGLLRELDRLLADPPRTAGAARRGTDVLPGEVARAYRRLRRRMRRARRAAAGPGHEAALHEARKAAKRARYAAEALQPLCGGKAQRFARQMKKVQSVLGEHHDAVVARAVLRELGVSAFLAGENGFTFGLLYERQDGTARRLSDQARRTWKQASAARYRRWLR